MTPNPRQLWRRDAELEAGRAVSHVQPVSDADFDQVVLGSDQPVLVDFWAEWCGPCQQIAPIIEELAVDYGERIKFFAMDADANPITPADQQVLGLPTINLYRDGKLVTSFRGPKPKATLLKALQAQLDASTAP